MQSQSVCCYNSPVGRLLLSSDELGLTGLWPETDRFLAGMRPGLPGMGFTPFIEDAIRWLDVYFSGRRPDFTPRLHLVGSDFRVAVWKLLLEIPYGEVTTYGALASAIARQRSKKSGLAQKMSAQAIGNAVGHNSISIIVPCHRVIGSGNNLTGYGSGIPMKMKLLELEGIDTSGMTMPKRCNATRPTQSRFCASADFSR